jgi:hypothetical protein
MVSKHGSHGSNLFGIYWCFLMHEYIRFHKYIPISQFIKWNKIYI